MTPEARREIYPNETGRTEQVVQSVISVPVERIIPNPDQPRKVFDKDALYRLSLSLKKCGQRRPGILFRIEGDPEHDYLIVDGERRWRALQLAGMPEFKATVSEYAESAGNVEDQLFEESVVSNFGYQEHTHNEITNAIVRLREKNRMTVEEIAQALSKTPSFVFQHFQLLKLDPVVRRLVDESLPEDQQLGYTIAVTVLAKIENPKHQIEAAQHIVAKQLNLYEARNYVRSLGRKHGFPTRRSRPSDDLPVLESFVKRLISDSDSIAEMRQNDFSTILMNYNVFQVSDLLARMESANENLNLIRQSIKEVLDRKRDRVKEFSQRKMA